MITIKDYTNLYLPAQKAGKTYCSTETKRNVQQSIITNDLNMLSFGSAGYIWGGNNKTLVLETNAEKDDANLFLEFVEALNKQEDITPKELNQFINQFIKQTTITAGEIQTDKNDLNLKAGSKSPDLRPKIISHILKRFAQNEEIDVNIVNSNYDSFKKQCQKLNITVEDRNPSQGLLKIQKKATFDIKKLQKTAGTERIWKEMAETEINYPGDNRARGNKIREILTNPMNVNPDILAIMNGWLKAESIGIVPSSSGNMPAETKKAFLENFIKAPEAQKLKTLALAKSICIELPSERGNYPKIANRGPIRHGILGFKNRVIHGDNWVGRLGEAGRFPQAIHQLSHQIPAPELGYICKAYAQYLRTGGNIEEFDRYLKDNNVDFEEYFVKNAKLISSSGDSWCQISPDKPKCPINNVSGDEIRSAFSHNNWSGKNIDELMAREENKVAMYFDVYGDIMIDILKGMGIELSTGDSETHLPESIKSRLGTINNLMETAPNQNDSAIWLKLLGEITQTRTQIVSEITNTKDHKQLNALIEIDNKLEAYVNATITSNMLSKALKNEGLLYKLCDSTEKLFLNLLDNYSVTNNNEDSLESKELKLLNAELKEAFNAKNKGSKEWSEHTLVSINRLQRLISTISNNVSEIYKPIGENLAKIASPGEDKTHLINQMTDGILRGDLIFSISQITTGFRSEIRKLAGASPWQVISPGETKGEVIHAHSMDELQHIIQQRKNNHQNVKNLICLVDNLIGAEEPPEGVSAIITPKVIDTLAHLGVRCRQESIIFACLDDSEHYNELKDTYANTNRFAEYKVADGNVKIVSITFEEASNGSKTSHGSKAPVKVILPEAIREYKVPVLGIEEIKLNTSGPKAYNISKLAGTVPVPESNSVPFAVLDKVFNDPINVDIKKQYDHNLTLIGEKERTNDLSVIKELKNQRALIEQLQFPEAIINGIRQKVLGSVPEDTRFLITRSSTNGEDLKDFSGAGLYESFPGVTKDKLDLYIKKVWASKWCKRAYDARVKAQIPHTDLAVSVLIQPCIDAKYAFVTHTTNPLTNNANEVYIDMVQGQGEALVSGEIPGLGYTFTYNKDSGEVKRLHLADKSYKLVPDGTGGLKKDITDYRDDVFTKDQPQWDNFIKQIGEYSVNIEKLYDGKPQDIEGTIKDGNNKIYIVQTRDQLGIKENKSKANLSFQSIKAFCKGESKIKPVKTLDIEA